MQPPPSMTHSARPSTSTLRASIFSLRQSVEVSNLAPQPLPALEFGKIRATLQNGSNNDQCMLLQALRWRLTRSLPGTQQDDVLTAYISHYLLGCRGNGDPHPMLVLMQSREQDTREQIARLFNTFSSLADGRSYLSEAPPITNALLETIYFSPDDQAFCCAMDCGEFSWGLGNTV